MNTITHPNVIYEFHSQTPPAPIQNHTYFGENSGTHCKAVA